MRWFLAGLSFAVLVGLAVATVAVKATNVGTRARLNAIDQRILFHTVELARRMHAVREATARERLARAWRQRAAASTS